MSAWKSWGRTTAAVISVAAAVSGILFSAWSAHVQAGEQRQTRAATELGLVTQLDAAANQSERDINDSAIPEKFDRSLCGRRKQYIPLSPRESAALYSALGHYEYFAWLFNTRQLEEIKRQSVRYWAPRMLDAYHLATAWEDPQDLRARFPQLETFRIALRPRLRYRPRCSAG
jgi:hypothetical protein